MDHLARRPIRGLNPEMELEAERLIVLDHLMEGRWPPSVPRPAPRRARPVSTPYLRPVTPALVALAEAIVRRLAEASQPPAPRAVERATPVGPGLWRGRITEQM
jgi:hypothetical protein